MKASDLVDRSTEDLAQLLKDLKKDLFSYRMKNVTGQLSDTSLVGKARKDVARIQMVLRERTIKADGGAA